MTFEEEFPSIRDYFPGNSIEKELIAERCLDKERVKAILKSFEERHIVMGHNLVKANHWVELLKELGL